MNQILIHQVCTLESTSFYLFINFVYDFCELNVRMILIKDFRKNIHMINFYNHSPNEYITCMIKLCCYNNLIMYLVVEGPKKNVNEDLKGCYNREKGKKIIMFYINGIDK